MYYQLDQVENHIIDINAILPVELHLLLPKNYFIF